MAREAEALLTPRQAADRLGLSAMTLARFRLDGNGPKFAKLGRSIRYRAADLDEFVAARVRRSTSEASAAGRAA